MPAYPYKLKKEGEKLYILDELRKKYLVLTPEEWVRQHFVQFLVNRCAVPRSLINIEGGTGYNGRQKRTDVLVYGRNGKPWLLAECKAPHVAINQEVLAQIGTYNHTIGAQNLAVTNGMETHFLQRKNEEWVLVPHLTMQGD